MFLVDSILNPNFPPSAFSNKADFEKGEPDERYVKYINLANSSASLQILTVVSPIVIDNSELGAGEFHVITFDYCNVSQ